MSESLEPIRDVLASMGIDMLGETLTETSRNILLASPAYQLVAFDNRPGPHPETPKLTWIGWLSGASGALALVIEQLYPDGPRTFVRAVVEGATGVERYDKLLTASASSHDLPDDLLNALDSLWQAYQDREKLTGEGFEGQREQARLQLEIESLSAKVSGQFLDL
ncbi:hypothetical protein JYT84_00605 [bacterium AH-315-M10]|nr:hypothetical protein [bacterium AH-315-M10]MBN4054977.1 hypothetical protein [Acidimicrobium ferrooxidans]